MNLYAKSLPNVISLSRLSAAPLCIAMLLKNQFSVACVVFLLASFSDILDGFVARALHAKSTIGSFLDPLADKILLMSLFLGLGWQGWHPPWLTVCALGRDIFIIAGVGILYAIKKPVIFQPSLISKINTGFQMALVFLSLLRCSLSQEWDENFWILFGNSPDILHKILIYVTALTTGASLVVYGYVFERLIRGSTS